MRRIFPLSALATLLATIFSLAPAEEADPATELASGRAESRVVQRTRGDSGGDSGGDSNRSSNEARIDTGAGERLLGNLGLNVAAGSGNAQSNTGALQRQSDSTVFATSTTSVNQSTRANRRNGQTDAPNEAGLDAALAGASGNLGINIIAGAGNAQSNQFAVVEVEQASALHAVTTVDQKSAGSRLNAGSPSGLRDSAQNATIGNGALFQLNGSVGVSVGAGNGNAQANSLSVIQSAR